MSRVPVEMCEMKNTDNRASKDNCFPKMNSLQGIRAFAFICIFLHHSSLNGMGALGPYGVSLFIILSGFLLGGKYLANNTVTGNGLVFTYKKLRGLFPLHIITMVVMICYYYFTSTLVFLPLLNGIIANTFMVIPYFQLFSIPMQSLNGPCWYLSICIISYLVFPFILNALRKYHSRKQAKFVIILCIGVSLLLSLISKQFHSTEMQKLLTYNLPILRLPEFIMGCNMGYLFITKKK